MKYLNIIILFIVILAISPGYFAGKGYFKGEEAFGMKRSEIMSEIDLALEEAVKSGDYKCCINPPCKMCYLGNWLFEDGKCDCDNKIAQGKIDEVCPECVHGMEEGNCESVTTDTCAF